MLTALQPPPEPKKPKILPEGEDLPKEERLRNKCINEIIETERDYIADLVLIKEVCYRWHKS